MGTCSSKQSRAASLPRSSLPPASLRRKLWAGPSFLVYYHSSAFTPSLSLMQSGVADPLQHRVLEERHVLVCILRSLWTHDNGSVVEWGTWVTGSAISLLKRCSRRGERVKKQVIDKYIHTVNNWLICIVWQKPTQNGKTIFPPIKIFKGTILKLFQCLLCKVSRYSFSIEF